MRIDLALNETTTAVCTAVKLKHFAYFTGKTALTKMREKLTDVT
jgi:hypothetical protein